MENDHLYSDDMGRELCSEHAQIPLKISRALKVPHGVRLLKCLQFLLCSWPVTAKQLAVLAKALGSFLPWQYFLKILMNLEPFLADCFPSTYRLVQNNSSLYEIIMESTKFSSF